MNVSLLRSVAFLIAFGSVLAGCSGVSGGKEMPATSAQSRLASMRASVLKGNQMMYVADEGHDAILIFAHDANGDIAPAGIIAGSNTQLYHPLAVALDSSGRLYVVNLGDNKVLIFSAGARGNVPPANTITGYDTKLQNTLAVVLDSSGEIYVSEDGASPGVYVFARGASGNTPPIRVIGGSATGLSESSGMAFDANKDLYVANIDPNVPTIAEFSPTANGNAKPIGTIGIPGGGGKSNLYGATSVKIGREGEVLVGNGLIEGVDIFKHGVMGDVKPSVVISGPATGIVQLFSLGLDDVGDIYVTNFDGAYYSILAFSRTAKGNASPIRSISGDNTILDLPCFPAFF